jgi:hypothetical protein
MNPQVPTVTIPVKGGTATGPSLPRSAAIVLVELTVDGVETVTRLDVQKIMFIDEVPAAWSREDTKTIAMTLCERVRDAENVDRG